MNGYKFAYDGEDFERARALGFHGYGGLTDVFTLPGDLAFQMFAARTPHKARPDYPELMESWGLSKDESDPYVILAATSGKLPTDQFEFIPVLEPVSGTCLYVDVAGFRFQDGSKAVIGLQQGTELHLRADDANPYDRFAVKILVQGHQIGWMKKVLSGCVREAMASGLSVRCCLDRINQNGQLHDVVVQLRYDDPA